MITKSEYITMRKNHRDLWQWLADYPMCSKSSWPKWGRPIPHNHCFLCTEFEVCCGCPLYKCMQSPSGYIQWERTPRILENAEKRSRLALEIRNAVPEWTAYQSLEYKGDCDE